jgi:hypothetical protein
LLNEAPNGYRIAKALNLPPSSVYNALKLLEHPFIGLVTHSQAEGIYYGEPKTDESLAQIAAVMFDGGSPSQARVERHRVEREIHAFRLVAGAIAHAEGNDRN